MEKKKSSAKFTNNRKRYGYWMKTAIITGAAGFIGYYLTANLQQKGIRVIAICRPGSVNNQRLKKFQSIEIIETDISKIMEHSERLKKYSPEVFFHLAWDGTTGEKRGDYHVQLENVRDTCDAYICASVSGCKKFVVSGTVYEYLTEQVLSADKFNPLSYYVMAKHYAYESILELSKKIGLDFTWCRFCQPIGKFIKMNQLMAYMVAEIKNGNRPQFGTAENPFDMIVVEDLAEALYLAGECTLKKRLYYIGSGHPRMLKDYLIEAGKCVNSDMELIFGERPDDGLKFDYGWLDPSEFDSETGFVVRYSFADGVYKVENWIEECRCKL